MVALAVLSGVLMVTQWVWFFDAIHRTSIAVATVVFHVQPFWVVLMGAAIFNERLGGDRLGWIATAFVGLVLASGVATTRQPAGTCELSDRRWRGAGRLGAVCERHADRQESRPVAPASADARAMSRSAWCACRSLRRCIRRCISGRRNGSGWSAWACCIRGLSYVLIYGALPKLTTPVIAVLLFVYPLTAIVVDAVVYGRALSAPQLAGMVLIVIASLGVNLGWPLVSLLRRGGGPRHPVD